MSINAIHHKKTQQKNPLRTLVLKYIYKYIFILCDKDYFVTHIIQTFKFSKVCCFQKKLINLNLKANQIYLK
jgi:hypothetical protein